MARTYVSKDELQREFVKVLDSMTGAYNRWEVWRDMVWCIAIAISNSVDYRFKESREQTYMSIIQKYDIKDVEKFAQLFAILHRNVVEKTEKGSYGDFLGELFMNLDLGNNLGGQFFTPYNICQMMARITIDGEKDKMQASIDKQGWCSCMDCACGAGATLIAAAEASVEHGINYPFQMMFAAQEIDSTTALMCYIQLSLLGCAGYVVIGDSLCDPMTGHVLFGENSERCWYTPMFFEQTWHERREIEISRRRFQHMMNVISGLGGQKDADEKPAEPEPVEIAAEPENAEQTVPASLLDGMTPLETIQVLPNDTKPKQPRSTARKHTASLEGQITFQF